MIALTTLTEHNYVKDVISKCLLGEIPHKESSLFQELLAFSIWHFELKTRLVPQPLPDWRREMPDTLYNTVIWNMLKPFLLSPTESFFDYKELQAKRKEVESAIRNVQIDLETETIKKGSPQTLRIKKNNAAHQREFNEWKVDSDILNELRAIH